MIQLPNGSKTTITEFVTDTSGVGISDFQPTFVLKCAASTSTNVGKFYDFVDARWSDTPIENNISAVDGITGAYSFTFTQSSIGVIGDTYLVRITSNKQSLFTYTYGGRLDDVLTKVASLLTPHRETITRVTNNVAEIAYFDENGVEQIRYRVTHDPSGAQPEQTREEI